VKKFSEEEKIEIALIENIQREDLSPIEEAYAFKRLIDISKLSQEEIAEKVGKNRSTIANTLRLLKLPEIIRDALDKKEISPGHARAILMLEEQKEQLALFRKIRNEELSVRRAERIASEMKMGKKKSVEDTGEKEKSRVRRSADILAVEKSLIEKLGTKVVIRGNENRGKIEISYFSLDDLNRILEIFTG
jgi:ParB family chromosome partitioning protein